MNGTANDILIGSSDLLGLQLATGTDGHFIQQPVFMNDMNVFDLGLTFTNSALVGNLESVAWGILSDGGLQIDIDKQGDAFARGQIKIRARFNGDFALTNPKLISLLTVGA